MSTKSNSSFDLHAPECDASASAPAEATSAHTNAHAEATRAHAEATRAHTNAPAEATSASNASARTATQVRLRTKARMSTRDIATIAMLAALAIVASFVCDIPLIPGATFLTYDPSGAIIMTGAFTYGPGPGVIIAFVTCIVHGSSSGIIGVAVNLIVSCTLALGAGWFGRLFTHIPRMSSSKHAPILCAYLATSVIFIAVALAMNLLLTPLYTGLSLSSVIEMIVPILLPFNLIKAALNTALAYVLTIALTRILPAANGRRKAASPVAEATAVSAEATSEGAAPTTSEGAAPAPAPARPEGEASIND